MSEKKEETFNELIGNLNGFAKPIAKKILNNGFAEEVKKIFNKHGVENANDALKGLVDAAVQKAANGIRLKITMILIIIASIFAVLAIIAMLAASGNIAIPIAISVVLIAMIWFATGAISKLIVHRVSGIIFKAIEGKALDKFSGRFNKKFHNENEEV
jgi:hypothetical protein